MTIITVVAATWLAGVTWMLIWGVASKAELNELRIMVNEEINEREEDQYDQAMNIAGAFAENLFNKPKGFTDRVSIVAQERLEEEQKETRKPRRRNKRRALTNEEVKLIRRGHKNGVKIGTLADDWGVSPGTINNVVNRKGAYA